MKLPRVILADDHALVAEALCGLIALHYDVVATVADGHALVTAATARAETINCTAITTLPAVITQPGLYCLTADLTTAIGAVPWGDIPLGACVHDATSKVGR